MSFGALDWVFKHSQTKGSDRLVMIALAHALNVHEGDQFESCWPGKASIAQNAGLSERQVQRCIQALVSAGELASDPHPAWSGRQDRRPNQYRFPLMERGDSLSPRAQRGDTHGINGETPTAQRGDTVVSLTKRELKEELKASSVLFEQEPSRAVDVSPAKDLDQWFERVWENYPRKQEKQGAKAAFIATVRRGADPEALLAAATRYAERCRRDQTEPKFIKHGKTFFGPKEPWTDLAGELTPDEEGQHYDENGDPYTDSEWAAISSSAFLETPEARRWNVRESDGAQ